MSFRIAAPGESPNVRKAKGLIEDLNHIKHQVQGLVEVREFLSKIIFCTVVNRISVELTYC